MFNIPQQTKFLKHSLSNFTRKIKLRYIARDPIHPGDSVIVKPIFGDMKLNAYQERFVQNNEKLQEESKIRYGNVIRVLRKTHQVIVQGVNKKEEYTSPEIFMSDYERKNFSAIKRKVNYLPVDISRVSLRDLDSTEFKGIEVFTKKDENGVTQRYNKETGEIIPKNIPYKSYFDRHFEKKEGKKDTPGNQVTQKTYFGEDFVGVAQEFLARIKEKKQVESLLFLKDK
jgi:ribosomal protein L24